MLTKRYSFATDVPPSLVRFVARMHDATPLDVLAELFPAFDCARQARRRWPVLQRRRDADRWAASSDLMTPADHSRAMVEQVPGAELVILPEAGHLVMLEHHDVVTDHLRDLRRARPAAPQRDLGVTTDDPTCARPRAATGWADLVDRACAAASPAPSSRPAAPGCVPGEAPAGRGRAARG